MPATPAYSKILVALDGSKAAEAAIAHAEALARRFGRRLVLLEVCAPERFRGPAVATEYLRSVAERIQEMAVEIRVSEGGLPETILQTVVELGADLLVVSSRGEGATGLSGAGRVVQELLRSAPCTVLVVGPTGPA